MSLQYIIDGCNIIHHIRFNPRIIKKAGDSRVAFLEFVRMHKLCGSHKNKITVVFDGYPDPHSLNLDKTDINVVFSRQETADERIKKLLEASANPKNIVVVSDDKEIKFFARGIGSRPLGVEDFIRPKEKEKSEEDSLKVELTYSQMHKINEELKMLWLK